LRHSTQIDFTVSHTLVGSGQSLFDSQEIADPPPPPPLPVTVPPPTELAALPLEATPEFGGSILSASEQATSATSASRLNRFQAA